MAKGRPNPNWKTKILEWKASGKNRRAWCQENKIPYTTFSGWEKRLKQFDNSLASAGTGFIELKDQKRSDSGITLEYNGVRIHLKAEFDQIVFEQCLNCLRGALC